jgi:HPt (histidine-containing phosphotransfer) domain-containing protein
MDDYLAKPVIEAELRDVLARWIDARRAAGPEPPVLDPGTLDNLRELGGGTDEVIQEVAVLYTRDAPARIAAMNAAIARGDAAALAAAAHAFKSSSGNIGATRMHALTAALELLGNSGSVAGAEGLARQLEDEYARVESALRELAG